MIARPNGTATEHDAASLNGEDGEECTHAPRADEIERLFRAPMVVTARPVLLGGLSVLKLMRRFSWQADGLEHLENLEPPLVFAANHRSHADTAAILGTLPRHLRGRTAVAAALDVFGNDQAEKRLSKELLLMLVAAGFHAFAFDRLGPPLRSIRTSVQLIRDGWNLLLYPEGTRSRTNRMGPFKAGIGVLARFTNRPVIPVYVDGGEVILPHGVFMPRSGFAQVRFGAPLCFEKGDTPAGFTARLRESVCQLGGEPVDGYEGVQMPVTRLGTPKPRRPRQLAY